MTEDEFNAATDKMAGDFAELYAKHCAKVPKVFVLMAMTGSLAACSTEAGAERNRVIAALNSAFDDIEAGEPR